MISIFRTILIAAVVLIIKRAAFLDHYSNFSKITAIIYTLKLLMENSIKGKIAAGPEKLYDFQWYYIDGEEKESQKREFTHVLIRMYFKRFTVHKLIDGIKSLDIKSNLRKNRKANL